MKLVIDMNLSPEWVGLFETANWQAQHWNRIGPDTAPDSEILDWAKVNDSIIVTQDLDFSQLLFALKSNGPSVVLIRIPDVLDESRQPHIINAIRQAEAALNKGALLVIGPKHARLRRLPIEG